MWARTVVCLMSLLGLTACASGEPPVAAPGTSSPPTPAQSGTGHVEDGEGEEDASYYVYVEMKRGRFDPSAFGMAISQELEFENEDDVLHNFTLPALDMSIDVEPEEEVETSAILLAEGTYPFYCKYHRARGMRGELTMTKSLAMILQRRGY